MELDAEAVQAIIFADVKICDKPIEEIKVFGLSPIKHLYYALRFFGISNIAIVGQNIEKKKVNLSAKFYRNLAEVSAKKRNLIIFANAILAPDDIRRLIKEDGIFVIRKDSVAHIVAIHCSEDVFAKIKGLDRINIKNCRKFLSKIIEVKCIFLTKIEDIKSAEEKIRERITPKIKRTTPDGIIAKTINRRVSLRITKIIANTNITPNQITIFATLLMIFGASLLLLKSRIYTAIAGIIIQLACIIDGCDGEIARLKYMQSDRGAVFDSILDRIGDFAVILAITFTQPLTTLTILISFLALFGSMMVSYTSFLLRFVAGLNIRRYLEGRDCRCFIISLFSLAGFPFYSLILIAFLTNLAIICKLIKIQIC